MMVTNNVQRINGRAAHQLRDLSISFEPFGYADASVLFCQGNTKVLVGVSLQQGVPSFLKGQGTGWLTAEYAMLPTSTSPRSQRESTAAQRNGRSVEISRLIGRCLRTVVNLDLLGEKTIYIDCEVLQADGGTRVACISAASMALERATERWVNAGLVPSDFFKEPIAGLSVGFMHGVPLVDLDQREDSSADVDFNFVMTQSGKVVEIQGTSEKQPMDWTAFEAVKQSAIDGIAQLFATCSTFSAPLGTGPLMHATYQPGKYKQAGSKIPYSAQKSSSKSGDSKPEKPAFFSLGNR